MDALPGYHSDEFVQLKPMKTIKNQSDSSLLDESCQLEQHSPRKNGPSTEPKPILWTQLTAALAVSMVGFSIGVVWGLPGVLLPVLMDPDSDDLILNKDEAALFSSVISLGAIIGALLAGPLNGKFGQRKTQLFSLPIGAFSWIATAFSPSFRVLVTSRLIVGIVMGCNTTSSSNYIVEVAHASVRGQLLAFSDLSRQMGIMFVLVVGSTSLTWRSVCLICGVTSMVIPIFIFAFLPNSPRWLATKGRLNEAKTALTFFRGPNYDVEAEMSKIWNQIQLTGTTTNVLQELKLFRNFKLFLRFSTITFFILCSQFNGNFIVITYSVLIFKSAKLEINDYTNAMVSVSMRIIGSSVYVLIADRFNRKPLYMIPLFVCVVSLTVLGFYFNLMLTINVSYLFWLPLTCLIVFNLFSSMSTPIITLLRSELMPNSVRNLGTNMCLIINAIGRFTVVTSYPYMIDSIGSHWTFWIYSLVSLFMIVFMSIFIPETRGKSLEEIGEL